MKYYYLNSKDEKIIYSFKNKKEELEYINICEILWGSVPCNVIWATGTNSYIEYKKNLSKIL